MVSEGQPLDMIKEIVPQPEGDTLGRARRPDAAQVREPSFHARQCDKTEREKRQLIQILTLGEDGINNVAEEQVSAGARRRPNGDADERAQVDQPEPRHHAP